SEHMARPRDRQSGARRDRHRDNGRTLYEITRAHEELCTSSHCRIDCVLIRVRVISAFITIGAEHLRRYRALANLPISTIRSISCAVRLEPILSPEVRLMSRWRSVHSPKMRSAEANRIIVTVNIENLESNIDEGCSC